MSELLERVDALQNVMSKLVHRYQKLQRHNELLQAENEQLKQDNDNLHEVLQNWEAKYRENFQILLKSSDGTPINKKELKTIKPKLTGKSDNILLNTNFTLKNFKKVFFQNEFFDLLSTTFYYTFFGAIGSIVFGILTAQLVNQKFFGRTFMRSVLLFPYVGPVVALAYTWELLLDPYSGTLNNLLMNLLNL